MQQTAFLCKPLNLIKFFMWVSIRSGCSSISLQELTANVWEQSVQVNCVESLHLRQKGVCRRDETVWRIFPSCSGSARVTQSDKDTHTSSVSSNTVSLHTDMHTQPSKRKRSKPRQRAYCLVCPAPCFVLHWMGLHSWLGTQMDFVGSHYEQDSKSVYSLLQWRDSKIQTLKNAL